jgi:hypothetical protein
MLMIEAPKCEHDEMAFWVVDMLQRDAEPEGRHPMPLASKRASSWHEGRELFSGKPKKPVMHIEIQCPQCISKMLSERR